MLPLHPFHSEKNYVLIEIRSRCEVPFFGPLASSILMMNRRRGGGCMINGFFLLFSAGEEEGYLAFL